ncbi:MAG: hypothetical protein ACC662_10500, partial [Planctomycetota bacterium]
LKPRAMKVRASPAVSFFHPVPALMAVVRDRQDPARPEPLIIYRAALHSPNFYLGRPTCIAANGEGFARCMGNATRAFVVCRAKRRADLEREVPGMDFRELARGPHLVLSYRLSILGEGPTTRDVLLLEARPRSPTARLFSPSTKSETPAHPSPAGEASK